MPKKSKKKKDDEFKDIDWTKDEIFEKSRSMIYIEHSTECPIYKTRAEALLQFLQNEVPERQFVMILNNNGKTEPRKGAFEVKFSQNARTSAHDIWSGIDKGPPRKEKFPQDFYDLMPKIRAVLKKVYAELESLEIEDDYVPE